MLKKLFYTDNNAITPILRLVLGLVIFPHGAQKTLGWFGGYGFSATLQFFSQQMHIPGILAFLVILTESLGALCLMLGLVTRIWAGLLTVIMLVAINMHSANGFFMNWNGTQKGEGFEYHLLVIGITLVLMIKGAGRWSADRSITLAQGARA